VARQAPDSGSDPERSPLPRVVLRRQPGNQDRGARRWSAGGQDAKNEVLEHCRRAAESSAAEVTRSTPAPARPGARRHQRAPRRGSRRKRMGLPPLRPTPWPGRCGVGDSCRWRPPARFPASWCDAVPVGGACRE